MTRALKADALRTEEDAMAFPLPTRGSSAAAAAFLLVACGPVDAPPGASSGADATAAQANRAPRITALRIEPEAPVAGEAVRAYATAQDPDGESVSMRYAWSLDGDPLGDDTPKLLLGEEVTRGSVVAVTAVASDGRASSLPARAEAVVRNRAPVVEQLTIDPEGPLTAGLDVEVGVRAVDPDGDPLEIEYVWRVNDALQLDAKGASFATKHLRSGDRVAVSVRAYDGFDYSRSLSAPPLVVGNQPPRVVSHPEPAGPGETFAYQIRVRDPDASTPPVFALASAPDGMAIDAASGRVEWKPRADQTGRHAVRVVIDDGQGARVAHDFEVVVQAPASRAKGS